MKRNIIETLIGAVVIVVAFGFLIFAYSTVQLNTSINSYQAHARFNRIDGLTIGSDVRLSGVKIGVITDEKIDPQTFEGIITFNIEERIKLPVDTNVRILSNGLLGDNYLALEPGISPNLLQPEGEFTNTQGALNVMDLVAQAIFKAAERTTSSPNTTTPQN
ncbi:MAG: outer membrane lipid asymmetry maintenance protein MlaD [Alphaproteobacteria bacterium]|nr:outer membrane lipid asymmetry maintenance protein MlaD [Alphaproteobacteria bacterium]